MKNKYLIRVKGLTTDEQTEFIASNLKDNVVRLKFVMLILTVVELFILLSILIPDINIVPDDNRTIYLTMYFIVIIYSLLFTGVLHYMSSHQSAKNAFLFRLIILSGLMILLFWGASVKLLAQGSFFHPSIYMLLLLSVSVIPFFNYWEILIVTLPSLIFITIITIVEKSIQTQAVTQIVIDSWGFVLLAIMFSSIQYVDRIQYFKNDLQLLKQNILLKKHSEIDALTDIFNRRKLDETMEFEWKRSSRTKQHIAFLLIDLDNFKNYNDSYGHIEGDLCLRRSAAIMKESLKRSSDMIFRYGGEEFGAILLFTDINAANIVAEKIRKNIENAGIIHKESSHGHVTVSIGVTASVGNKDEDYHSMYIEADKALYAAKRSGRNKVIAFEK